MRDVPSAAAAIILEHLGWKRQQIPADSSSLLPILLWVNLQIQTYIILVEICYIVWDQTANLGHHGFKLAVLPFNGEQGCAETKFIAESSC